MRKEDFMKLGLDEETAKKCETSSLEELKSYIPKTRFDEVNNEKKKLELDIRDRDSQLEALKNSTGDVEAMKKQIATLQADNKAKDEAHAEEIKQMKIDSAVENAIAGAKGKNAKAIRALLDFTNAEIDDKGEIKGLMEQIKNLQTADDSSFLFDVESSDKQPKFKGLQPGGQRDGVPSAQSEYETRLAEARKNGNTLEAIKIKQEASLEGIALM